jgi:hypothetical protein
LDKWFLTSILYRVLSVVPGIEECIWDSVLVEDKYRMAIKNPSHIPLSRIPHHDIFDIIKKKKYPQNVYSFIMWIKFVTNFYREIKKTNPAYKFKDALKDAAKEYKGTTRSSSSSSSSMTQHQNTKKKYKKRHQTKRRRK